MNVAISRAVGWGGAGAVRLKRFTAAAALQIDNKFNVVLPSQEYDNRIERGLVKNDDAQRTALRSFDHLFQSIVEYHGNRTITENKLDILNRELIGLNKKESKQKETDAAKGSQSWFYGNSHKISLLGNLFSSTSKNSDGFTEKDAARKQELLLERASLNVPRGLYVYGGPGSGKTYLMDLFFSCIPEEMKKDAKRVHFNEFMLEVHRSLHTLQLKGVVGDDMVRQCVENIKDESRILCFDEFQVTDIADAMIMKQLFTNLHLGGVITVMTSNRKPDELYKNGIQRDLFLPFIKQIETDWDVVKMQSKLDYRKILMPSFETDSSEPLVTLFFRVGDRAYEKLWQKFCNEEESQKGLTLNVQGRLVTIPALNQNCDVARFSFDDLCARPLGPADYATLAANFHTIFIDSIPKLNLNSVNQMRRFITLVDTLYDQNVVIVATSEVSIDEIMSKNISGKTVQDESDAAEMNLQETDLLGTAEYVPQKGNVDEVFAMDRTLSRLHEMQQPKYLRHIEERIKLQIDNTSPFKFFTAIGVKTASDSSLKQIFHRYDVDHDSLLSDKELRRFLEEVSLFTRGYKKVSKLEFIETKQGIGEKPLDISIFTSFYRRHGLKL